MVFPAVAAGHRATAEAGAEILEAGGNAADAAVAACLASCVAETVMTGIAGGGHAIWWDGERAELLDFFVAVPGLGAEPRHPRLLRLEVPFGSELVHYAVGPASCGVPGVPAGLGALHARGSLPWSRLVEPALRLARDGVEMPAAHVACLRMLEPVMTMDAGARIYAPGGRLIEPGGRLEQPGLVRMLGLLAEEGPQTFYGGTIATELLELMEERGGLVTADDLREYAVLESAPHEGEYAGRRLLARSGLNSIFPPLAALPLLRGRAAGDRAVALAAALGGEDAPGHTTNLAVADAEGNACVVTTSLGLGSGDFLPGLDVHLNSMLGEADLVVGPLEPGSRMPSMMAPALALDGEQLELAIGSAGGTRLRSALVQVLAGVLDEGRTLQDAISRPRLHPVGRVVHLEPGQPAEVAPALQEAGYEVSEWPGAHHYFGGVSAVGGAGAGADSRRDGYAVALGPESRGR